MATDVLFPHMSDEVDEGVLVTWFVEAGARVDEGALVASVQVEKVEEEVYAPAAGQVLERCVGQGEVARQGAVIARIGAPDEQSAPGGPAVVPPAGAAPPEPVPAATVPIASPAARRVARELGVDLAAVHGTGPGGRIVEDDVRRVSAEEPSAGEPLPGTRRLMADRLRNWLAATAQFTLTSEVDVSELAHRQPPWTAAVVRACALALRHHPRLASRWRGDRLVPPDTLDVGVAVSVDDGLVVPVVHRADEKDLATLAGEVAALAERATAGTLTIDDVSGAVFAVTNLGGYPVDAFTPLVHQPQTAILGVGRARARPAVVDDRIEPRTTLVLSLTVDHQVTDGAPAAAFLADVADLLVHPERLD
jgi:pyruvate/2-oxoglutarate dehydrogenase complex dihydrolipoamide acyltransferase (E2) component